MKKKDSGNLNEPPEQSPEEVRINLLDVLFNVNGELRKPKRENENETELFQLGINELGTCNLNDSIKPNFGIIMYDKEAENLN